jgi:hypothetical protein
MSQRRSTVARLAEHERSGWYQDEQRFSSGLAGAEEWFFAATAHAIRANTSGRGRGQRSWDGDGEL